MSRLTFFYTVSILFAGMVLVLPLEGKAQAKGFTIVQRDGENRIDIQYNGALITSYLYPDTLDKPVLYPLRTLNGVEVTRGFPLVPRLNERVDHPHHIGVWFNFGDVNGLDFWNNSSAIAPERKPLYGSVRHRTITSQEGGRNSASLAAESDWVDREGNVLLAEETGYVFRKEDVFLTIERVTVLTAVADTVVFGDNKEGLFAIRVAREFEEQTDKEDFFVGRDGLPSLTKSVNDGKANGVYRNSEGVEGGDVWGKKASWVVLSAEKDEMPISIAIFDHPGNPGFPACSHARGYGLFAVNNLGRQAFDKTLDRSVVRLSKGEKIQFRHKLLVKSGEFASDEELTKHYDEFR